MIAVVDASVALKWVIQEDGSAEASALLTGPYTLIAPELIIAEVANAGWKAVRSGGMTLDQHDQMAIRLPLAFDSLIPIAALVPRAVAISRSLDHAVYDCFYVALAEERQGSLITADKQLLRRLQGTEWAALAMDLYA